MRIFSLSLIVAIGLASCRETETPGGVKFTILKKGDGKEILSGEMILVHMVMRNPKDSVVHNTWASDIPMIVPMPDASLINDTGEFGVLKMLTKGDCVTFKVPTKMVFATRRRAVPKELDPESLFTYIIQMKDVVTAERAETLQQELQEKMFHKQSKTDSTIIAQHLKAKGEEALSTPSGLRYIVKKAGKGENAALKKTASVHYAGYFLNGKIFDTSSAKVAKANGFDNGGRNEPYPIVVGESSVIMGWHEILQLMNKGMRVTVYIPSGLAYGPRGRDGIPPNTVLMFDMEIMDLK